MAFCIGISKKNKILGEEFPYREVWDRPFVCLRQLFTHTSFWRKDYVEKSRILSYRS